MNRSSRYRGSYTVNCDGVNTSLIIVIILKHLMMISHYKNRTIFIALYWLYFICINNIYIYTYIILYYIYQLLSNYYIIRALQYTHYNVYIILVQYYRFTTILYFFNSIL